MSKRATDADRTTAAAAAAGTGSGVAATETVVDAAAMDRATAGACVAPTPGRA